MIENLPSTDNKVISILSGGLDSTLLTYMLVEKYGNKNVIALTFNYGQKQNIEIEKSKKTCSKLNISHTILDISFLANIVSSVTSNVNSSLIDVPNIQNILGDPQPITYIPFRNIILHAISLSFAESNNIKYVFNGSQVHDEYGYWDTSEIFFDKFNDLISLNRSNNIKILTPFLNLSKKDELILTSHLNIPYEDTISCYNPKDDISCGVCPSCSERIKNFALSGIRDTAKYSIYIDWDKILCVQ